MQNSTLSDHLFVKGVFKTKLNELLGEKKSEQSWNYERMPEYLWIGLILEFYGREDGLSILIKVLMKLEKEVKCLETLRFSDIINLNEINQNIVYAILAEYIKKDILIPLTIIVDPLYSNCFIKAFLVKKVSIGDRLSVLTNIINKLEDGSSDLSTDVRFVVVKFLVIREKLIFVADTGQMISEYLLNKHEADIMRYARPFIRSTELMVLSSVDKSRSEVFLNGFWERMFRMTDCKLITINHNSIVANPIDLLNEAKDLLNSYNVIIQQSFPLDDKRIVSLGIGTYAFKRFSEVVMHNLSETIAGRSSIRSMIECLFILKYLKQQELVRPNIWRDYQLHGIGKFKLIFERYLQFEGEKPETHVQFEYLDLIVREFKDKELIDMDTRLFDSINIRLLSEQVGEKDLYDFCYDYDSSYEHALWGAIRESSYLKCVNPTHIYHIVPDIDKIGRASCRERV